MKFEFDITAQEFEIVNRILSKNLPKTCQAWVFGSRAKHQTKFNSDLDLALSNKEPIDQTIISKIKDEFTDSDLPYTVDVLDTQSIEPYFQAIIDRYKILFPLKSASDISPSLETSNTKK